MEGCTIHIDSENRMDIPTPEARKNPPIISLAVSRPSIAHKFVRLQWRQLPIDPILQNRNGLGHRNLRFQIAQQTVECRS